MPLESTELIVLETMLGLPPSVDPGPVRGVDATRLTGNGTTYAAALPCPESARAVLQAVMDTRPPFDPEELRECPHVTLVYSRNSGVDVAALRLPEGGFRATARVVGVEYWDGHNGTGYVVAKLESDGLKDANRRLVAAGATHSFDDYCPHMTIAAKVGPKTPEIEKWVAEAAAALVAAPSAAPWSSAGYPLEISFDRVVLEDIRND